MGFAAASQHLGPKQIQYRRLDNGEIRIFELEPGVGEQQIRGSLKTLSRLRPLALPDTALFLTTRRPIVRARYR